MLRLHKILKKKRKRKRTSSHPFPILTRTGKTLISPFQFQFPFLTSANPKTRPLSRSTVRYSTTT